MSNLEKQAVYRLRGGKGKKKSTADSVTTQTSDLSSLTAKVDKLTSSVAKISQIVGKRHARNTDPDYNSDDETLFPDNSEADDQSLQSASSSKSSKRRKSAHQSAHPSPARQGNI